MLWLYKVLRGSAKIQYATIIIRVFIHKQHFSGILLRKVDQRWEKEKVAVSSSVV